MLWQVLTSFDAATLTAFVAAGIVLNFTPGVDFIYVAASGVAGGPKQGAAAALGINFGILVHVLLAAGGIAALLATYPVAYDAIRFAGAAWLIWLAWKTWRATAGTSQPEGRRSFRRAVGKGFLTNVLNPKTALFIFAFIPQFTDPEIGPVWAQILVLGLIFMVNGFLFSLALGALSGRLGTRLRTTDTILNKITALIFGGLAARLILD